MKRKALVGIGALVVLAICIALVARRTHREVSLTKPAHNASVCKSVEDCKQRCALGNQAACVEQGLLLEDDPTTRLAAVQLYVRACAAGAAFACDQVERRREIETAAVEILGSHDTQLEQRNIGSDGKK
jgi:hypothetical protein